jgi:hypothetical protein
LQSGTVLALPLKPKVHTEVNMELSRANGSNPFSSLRNELTRLKGVLQRINQSITDEADTLVAGDQVAPAETANQNIERATQLDEAETTAMGAETPSRYREESLKERILELENQIKIKEWLLKTRDAQLKRLRYELAGARISLMTGEKNKWGDHDRRKMWG